MNNEQQTQQADDPSGDGWRDVGPDEVLRPDDMTRTTTGLWLRPTTPGKLARDGHGGTYRRRIEPQPSDSVSEMPIEQVRTELQARGIDTTAATARVLAAVHAAKQSQPQAGVSERLKCKFCGAAAKAEGEGWRAECGSWEFGRDAWDRSNGCYLRCAWRTQALELDELRQQVREAMGRLTAYYHAELIDSPGAFGVVGKVVDDLRKAVGDE